MILLFAVPCGVGTVTGWLLARLGWWWVLAAVLSGVLGASPWLWTQSAAAGGFGAFVEMVTSGLGLATGVGLVAGALAGRR